VPQQFVCFELSLLSVSKKQCLQECYSCSYGWSAQLFIVISGNVEIGNGYGVPGGGAYYSARLTNIQASKIGCLFTLKWLLGLSGRSWLANFLSVTETPKDETLEASLPLEKESEPKVFRKELPDYLKQKLKARGILKNEVDGGSIASENVSSICISYYFETFVFAHKKIILLLSCLVFCDQCHNLQVWLNSRNLNVHLIKPPMPSSCRLIGSVYICYHNLLVIIKLILQMQYPCLVK